jgi:Carboxymuconolactone decarboxylase family
MMSVLPAPNAGDTTIPPNGSFAFGSAVTMCPTNCSPVGATARTQAPAWCLSPAPPLIRPYLPEAARSARARDDQPPPTSSLRSRSWLATISGGSTGSHRCPRGPADAIDAIQDWDDNFPGQVINLTRLVANEPRLLKAFTAFIREVYIESDLTPSEVELAYTTASVANQCHY